MVVFRELGELSLVNRHRRVCTWLGRRRAARGAMSLLAPSTIVLLQRHSLIACGHMQVATEPAKTSGRVRAATTAYAFAAGADPRRAARNPPRLHPDKIILKAL